MFNPEQEPGPLVLGVGPVLCRCPGWVLFECQQMPGFPRGNVRDKERQARSGAAEGHTSSKRNWIPGREKDPPPNPCQKDLRKKHSPEVTGGTGQGRKPHWGPRKLPARARQGSLGRPRCRGAHPAPPQTPPELQLCPGGPAPTSCVSGRRV